MLTTLYYKDGVSDKVYQVEVKQSDDGYNVEFAYGRRGSTLNTGVKNSKPLSQDEAEKMADKLIREKMAKGYTPGPDGTVYKNTDSEGRFTGITPMLLNSISEDELEQYIQNDGWVLQQKYDGRRIMIRKQGDEVYAINRKGLIVGAPQVVLDEVGRMSDDCILDGEMVGDIYYVFDVVDPGILSDRLDVLLDLLGYMDMYIPAGNVVRAPTYHTTGIKRAMVETMKNEGREGVVFKDLHARYTPGRPASGGSALKCKFTATANVRVVGVNVKRSVG